MNAPLSSKNELKQFATDIAGEARDNGMDHAYVKTGLAKLLAALDRLPDETSGECIAGPEATLEDVMDIMAERAADPRSGDDPTRWCNACGAMRQADCHCDPIADNE